MTQTQHHLKTLDMFFDAVKDGRKTFEVRKNDRGFQTGDILVLDRYEETPIGLRQTVPFRTVRKRISYLLQGGQYGIDPAYCVLGLADEDITS